MDDFIEIEALNIHQTLKNLRKEEKRKNIWNEEIFDAKAENEWKKNVFDQKAFYFGEFRDSLDVFVIKWLL